MTAYIQWQNSQSAINWFNNITNKEQCTFIIFDIAEFYPSISKQLLLESFEYAKQIVKIEENEISIIMHARKSLLYNDSQPWTKRFPKFSR